MDGSSHSHGGSSKIRNNEKFKGKLEEQRKVVAANDKKGGISLVLWLWRSVLGILGKGFRAS